MPRCYSLINDCVMCIVYTHHTRQQLYMVYYEQSPDKRGNRGAVASKFIRVGERPICNNLVLVSILE